MVNIISGFFWLFISVSMEVIATLMLPQTNTFKNTLMTVLCLICYATSFFALSMLMGWISPVVAYAVWSGMGIVMISLLSTTFYKLRSSALEKVGICCIVAGLIVIAF
ncbi:DMT family transporter [Leclercia tamurae]|uniref:DMT family transporter n=1 Tax=Leclercia tamurae TaxID=2926467 RepID=UPI0036F4A070